MPATTLAFAVPDLVASITLLTHVLVTHVLVTEAPAWWSIDTITLVRALEIIWIDLILSGDNAVVIALACRGLPPQLQRIGIILGALTAVAMRIAFTVGVQTFLTLPWLKIVGGLVLLWIAFKLLHDQGDEDPDVAEARGLWSAIRIIAIADLVMSLDNVLAIAAAAHSDWRLFVFGLLVSIPLVMLGASIFTRLLERFPILIWLGAALLGWIAGELIATDPKAAPVIAEIANVLGVSVDVVHKLAAILGAALVVLTGVIARPRERRAAH